MAECQVRHIEELREAVRWVKSHHPFVFYAWVVLPEYLHCVMELPPDDADFAVRWRLIKMGFSKSFPLEERRSEVRQNVVNEGSGSGDTGSALFAMKRIIVHIWTMCISIRSNMAGFLGCLIGHIRLFIAWSSKASIHLTGQAATRTYLRTMTDIRRNALGLLRPARVQITFKNNALCFENHRWRSGFVTTTKL